jgi:hypothetical protein
LNNNDLGNPKYMNMKHFSMIPVSRQKSRSANLGIKTKIISSQFVLIVAAGLAACSLQAQGTISALATITETGTSGSEFEYSLSLENTGSTPIGAFWYGWTLGHFNLPSTPTSIIGPGGWTVSPEGNSVQFGDGTGSTIPSGGFGTFTFDSTASPSALTSGMNDGDFTGDSVVFSAPSFMSEGDQSDPPHASDPFVPTLQAVPEPSTFGLMLTGLTGMSFWLARRRSIG